MKALNVTACLMTVAILLFSTGCAGSTATSNTLTCTHFSLPEQARLLAHSPDGSTWLGATTNVIQLGPLQPGEQVVAGPAAHPHMTVWTPANGLAGGSVNGGASAPDGRVWITSSRGTSIFDGSRWQTYTGQNGQLSGHIAFWPSGKFWFLDASSLVQADPDLSNWVSIASGQKDLGFVGPDQLRLAADGSAWVKSLTNLARLTPPPAGQESAHWQIQLYGQRAAAFPLPWLTFIDVAPDNSLWASGRLANDQTPALAHFDPKAAKWDLYKPGDRNGLGDRDFVTALAAAPDGSAWIGTDTNGLFRFTPDTSGARWDHYTSHNGLQADRVGSLLIEPSGTLWVQQGQVVSRCSLK